MMRPICIQNLILGLTLAGLWPASVAAEAPIRTGDRVAIVGNTFADQLRVHGYLETLLIDHADASIRNLGWGGDTLTVRDRPTGFPTEESVLTAHKTDVIIACFGMGESFAGAAGIDEFRSDLKAFIASHQGKKYNGETEVRLVLVSPIAYENLGELTPAHQNRNQDLEAYTRAMGEVATEATIPFVNLFDPSRYLMEEAEGFSLTTNGIHLSPLGYWALGHDFFQRLVDDSDGAWRMVIDAETGEGNATGVGLSNLEGNSKSLSFVVTEKGLPSLPPPTDVELPDHLEARRDTLVVTHLDPGSYTLMVDDVVVATAKAEDWARGVAIDSSPAHQEAEAFRAAINDKNLQFLYGWKALNQVHIVGERRTSPSGQALPAELIEFNQLANERDETLSHRKTGKPRQWHLKPAQK